MGDSVHDPAEPLAKVAVRVLGRAGYTVVYPENINKLCCGKAFDTKGLVDEARVKAGEMEVALLQASDNGRHPIFCETSPCLAHMRKVLDQRLKMYEPIEFTTKYLMHRLTFKKVKHRVAIHPTCSTRLLGLAESFVNLAEQCAEEVVWPREIQCCGFSGDKGFSHPQLNKSALESLAEQIEGCEMGYSTSRTCEIGLSLHGKVPYRNIMFLLDLCTAGNS
jgi:D-lactate dehydrogenase